jgi:hypothetical protein
MKGATMKDGIKGPMWAIELIEDGKPVELLTGKVIEPFVVLFTKEAEGVANRFVDTNPGKRLIPLPDLSDVVVFLRRVLESGMEKVGFYSGESVRISAIEDILKLLNGG